MSLVTKLDSLATRVAVEFNAVRNEITAIGGLNNIDGGGPAETYTAGSFTANGGTP